MRRVEVDKVAQEKAKGSCAPPLGTGQSRKSNCLFENEPHYKVVWKIIYPGVVINDAVQFVLG